jgi:hypothetical protein
MPSTVRKKDEVEKLPLVSERITVILCFPICDFKVGLKVNSSSEKVMNPN